ncbi:hypothetical protein J4558_01530 [Leptolyngbya sp. 15MV]|nr:hypothetical protein J4558_01530 [Leptolyngbya sp. 15MV]
MTTQTYHRSGKWPLWRVALWAVVPALLALPAAGMLFSAEVNWSAGDFAIAALLLAGTALAADRVLHGTRTQWTKALLLAPLLAALLLVWAELAVGVFGTPFAGS